MTSQWVIYLDDDLPGYEAVYRAAQWMDTVYTPEGMRAVVAIRSYVRVVPISERGYGFRVFGYEGAAEMEARRLNERALTPTGRRRKLKLQETTAA